MPLRHRVEIDPNEPLKPGDRIILTYHVTTWVWSQATEIALIESRCEARKDFQLIGNTLPDENGLIEFEVLIIDPQAEEPELQRAGIGLTCLALSLVITTAGLWTWLILDKVEKLVAVVPTAVSEIGSTKGGQVALVGAGAVGVAILVAVLGKYIKIKR